MGICFIVVASGHSTSFDLNRKYWPALSLNKTSDEFVKVGYTYTILFCVPKMYKKNNPNRNEMKKTRKEIYSNIYIPSYNSVGITFPNCFVLKCVCVGSFEEIRHFEWVIDQRFLQPKIHSFQSISK